VLAAGWLKTRTGFSLAGGNGEANITSCDPKNELDFSVPWLTNRPFRFNYDNGTESIYVTTTLSSDTDTPPPPLVVLNAARDDIVLGFLIPPPPTLL